MFEQYAHALQSEVPHLEVHGDTYPPPRVNEILSNSLFVFRMACIVALFGGPQLLQTLGIQNTPWIYNWAQENKVCSIHLKSHTHYNNILGDSISSDFCLW